MVSRSACVELFGHLRRAVISETGRPSQSTVSNSRTSSRRSADLTYTVDAGGADVVLITVHRLRRKLEDHPGQHTLLLHTIAGVGSDGTDS